MTSAWDNPYMKTTTKIYLAIFLAVAAVFLFGFGGPHWREQIVSVDPPRNESGETDVEYIQRAFRVYNHAYFHDRLNTPTFVYETNEETKDMQGSTHCYQKGVNCDITLNPHYTAAPRHANDVILHEMCHLQTWNEDLENDHGAQIKFENLTGHGKRWRGCMLELDNAGAWRNILIDNYKGAE